MQALFGDKIGAWQQASADGDVAKLERHFATVMAEREADLSAEEGEAVRPTALPPSLSDAQLSSLPDDSLMPVQLKFRSMADFEPGRVAEQVPALKKLIDTRNQLRDLMTKVDRSEDLEKLLERVLQNETELKALSSQLGTDKPKE